MKKFVVLVTPEEAIKIAGNTFGETYAAAVDMAEQCRNAFRVKYSDADPEFNRICTIQAVFEAGRVQGIREERSRHKGQKCAHNKAAANGTNIDSGAVENGCESQFSAPHDSRNGSENQAVKRYYVRKINELFEKVNDISLLDLLYRIVCKSL